MKPKRAYSVLSDKPGPMDLCQTPPHALVGTLMKAIAKLGIWKADKFVFPRVWEPGTGEGILANALRLAQFKVEESDILLGQNFFEYQPEKWDAIVTNPPYGDKYHWLEHCYELGKPFALLMPVETVGAGSAITLFKEYGIDIIFMTPRVDFKMPDQKWFSSAQFPTAWFTRGLFTGGDLMLFAKVNNPPRMASRQVWKRNNKTAVMEQVTEKGYADWIERPTGFNWATMQFEYKEWQP